MSPSQNIYKILKFTFTTLWFVISSLIKQHLSFKQDTEKNFWTSSVKKTNWKDATRVSRRILAVNKL